MTIHLQMMNMLEPLFYNWTGRRKEIPKGVDKTNLYLIHFAVAAKAVRYDQRPKMKRDPGVKAVLFPTLKCVYNSFLIVNKLLIDEGTSIFKRNTNHHSIWSPCLTPSEKDVWKLLKLPKFDKVYSNLASFFEFTR